ncbi:hypothetical protein [Paenibacillus dokdonensis]|uniref:hypothetical protein n=1 Tax=Paenibacillus dokdonensis TaxID=2567944 RepID=UPI0010A85FFC|nr:hypothetical protein [Paenibacillus dokdonensis]
MDEVPPATYFINESDPHSGARVLDNNPPVGSFMIVEGAATNASTVNLSITGSDPDAVDRVSKMRFTICCELGSGTLDSL